MLPSDASTQRRSRRRRTRYSYASSAEERSGSDTISMSGVPARFRSTSDTPVGHVLPREVVHRLAGVLLEVNAVEPHALRRAVRAQGDRAPRGERPGVLRDLIALRQVRVLSLIHISEPTRPY